MRARVEWVWIDRSENKQTKSVICDALRRPTAVRRPIDSSRYVYVLSPTADPCCSGISVTQQCVCVLRELEVVITAGGAEMAGYFILICYGSIDQGGTARRKRTALLLLCCIILAG